MSNLNVVCSGAQRWKTSYRAAILENDTTAVGVRVSDAEETIVSRARELFHKSGEDAEVEREELDDALYALHALRTAAEHRRHRVHAV